jgi:hypothetical protein
MNKGWVYLSDGRVIEKGTLEHEAYLAEKLGQGPLIFGDEPDFVSPIDGKVYSGRAGMREHNTRHDVVNNRDLIGLPVGISGKAPPPTPRERRELRETIIEAARTKGYL